jgi:hypothetical protein
LAVPYNVVALGTGNLDASYSWDTEGRVTSAQYPDMVNPLNYQYDAMGRISSMSNGPYSYNTIAEAAYGPADQILTLTDYYAGSAVYTETRTFNNLLQLTRQTVPGVMDMQYVYCKRLSKLLITHKFSGSPAFLSDEHWGVK